MLSLSFTNLAEGKFDERRPMMSSGSSGDAASSHGNGADTLSTAATVDDRSGMIQIQ